MIRTIKRVSAATALALVLTGGTTAAQKAGGILRIYSAESPPGLSIYEQATPWGQGPLMDVYNNLILFDQHVAQNSLEAIRPDLATKWSWNEGGTELTFTLRQGVRWHEGMPFTAKDVFVHCRSFVEQGEGKGALQSAQIFLQESRFSVRQRRLRGGSRLGSNDLLEGRRAPSLLMGAIHYSRRGGLPWPL